MMKKGALFLAVCVMVAPSAWSTEEAVTGGRLLSDSLGARPSGLAEAGTALVGDLSALSFNPAGLPFMRRSEASARFQSSVGDVTAGALGYGGRRGRAGWGAAVSFLDAGDIDLAFSDGRRFTRRAQRDVSGQVGIGMALSDFLSLGVGGRFIRSSLVEEYDASAFAGDAGILFQTPVPGWMLGASVRNMGGELKYRREGDPLPGETRVGMSYAHSPEGLVRRPEDVPSSEWYMRDQEETPVFTAFLDGVRDQNGVFSGAAAFEWTQWPKAAFRAGYGWGENASGLTLGFGLNLLKYSLDYSWRFVEDLSPAHRISFSIYWE